MADWNSRIAFGKLALQNPTHGTLNASDYPVFDRSLPVKQRGVQYNQYYTGLYIQDEIGLLEGKLKLTLAGRLNKSY